MDVVYFSNAASNNTHRFVSKLAPEHSRWRLTPVRSEPMLQMAAPYILVLPTYGGGNDHHAVPAAVIRFLNDTLNRYHLRGIIASGNLNFGSTYCLAGDIVSKKLNVPVLHKFEILGTQNDVDKVNLILAHEMELT